MKRPLSFLSTLLLASAALAQTAPAPAAPAAAPAEPPPVPTLTAEPLPLPGGEGGDRARRPHLRRQPGPGGGAGRAHRPARPVRSGKPEVARDRRLQDGGGRRGGHGAGPTSVDEGQGYLFAIDRTGLRLEVVDPAEGKIVAGAPLAGSPDYVRYVAATSEVWVTEPDKDGIEIFSLSAAKPPVPAHKAFLAIPGGPESLVIDNAAKVGYANLWKSSTVVIDLAAAKVIKTLPNGCVGSRGLALDARHGLLFVGCAEGGADLLDLGHKGAIRDRFRFGAGTDIVAYNPGLRHLYVPASKTGQMAIVGLTKDGDLKLLGTAATAVGAHCVVADDHRQAWVCDPKGGRVLVVRDTLP